MRCSSALPDGSNGTDRRGATLATVGAETLATKLTFYRPHLSPLFVAEMAIIIGTDPMLAGLLIGFHESYTAVESHMRKIEGLAPNNRDFERARDGLPRVLQFADDYAQATLYLLPLQELGRRRRTCERLRRHFRPTQ